MCKQKKGENPLLFLELVSDTIQIQEKEARIHPIPATLLQMHLQGLYTYWDK